MPTALHIIQLDAGQSNEFDNGAHVSNCVNYYCSSGQNVKPCSSDLILPVQCSQVCFENQFYHNMFIWVLFFKTISNSIETFYHRTL